MSSIRDGYNDLSKGEDGFNLWRVVGWSIGIMILLVVLKLVFLPAQMVGGAINSAQGVVSKTIDPNNVIKTYEWFFDVNAQYRARVNQIKSHEVLITIETDKAEKSRLNIELAGMKQSCREMAERYNMEASKVNKSIFKTDATPESLNASNCEGK